MSLREYIKEAQLGKTSAGVLMHREKNGERQFFIVHPGGPYFKSKQNGYWGVPKGLLEAGENVEKAAKREFSEETGMKISEELIDMGTATLNSGKTLHCFLTKGDGTFKGSNMFTIEWPPKSGVKKEFPEIDKGEWHNLEDCKKKMGPNQFIFIERANEILDTSE